MLAYIGLGSNLQNPIKQVKDAINALASIPNINLIKASSLYKSKPLDNMVQPDYINAVCKIDAKLSAYELLRACQKIENSQHRVRIKRWGARTIDLDIIMYGNKYIDTKILTIPHMQMTNREFVLLPLYAIAPNLIVPKYGTLQNLVNKVDNNLYKIKYT